MNFLTGIYAIDAPASALNNGIGEETRSITKAIRVGAREYPYVSAQAVRFWLRETAQSVIPGWHASPVARGSGKKQQAFTLGDPITYWDDDLFGYMRAEKTDTFTRISPFRTSTLVAAAPVEIVDDFGVMARMDGHPVLHGHEFYRAVLVGGFSVDLGALGTFTARDRAGYRNLTPEAAAHLHYLPERDAYRLPLAERVARLAGLLRAFVRLQGGARQTLHYTDVAPAFLAMAVLRGGGSPFLHLLNPSFNPQALDEALRVYSDDYQSGVYVGLRQGFMDAAFEPLAGFGITPEHPRLTVESFLAHLNERPDWLD